MPIKPKRPCSNPSCPATCEAGQRWCEAHRQEGADRMRDFERGRGSSSDRGYDADWRRFREVWLHYHPVCEECFQPATEIHHIVPLRSGGEKYADSNLRALCHSCHSRTPKPRAR